MTACIRALLFVYPQFC